MKQKKMNVFYFSNDPLLDPLCLYQFLRDTGYSHGMENLEKYGIQNFQGMERYWIW